MPKADNTPEDVIRGEWTDANPLNRRVFYAMWYTDAPVQYSSGGEFRTESSLSFNDEPHRYRIHPDYDHGVDATPAFPWENPAPTTVTYDQAEPVVDWPQGQVGRIVFISGRPGPIVMRCYHGSPTLCVALAGGDSGPGATWSSTSMRGVRLNFQFDGIEGMEL